ncbi:hypothetical protein HF521_015613 [Silurus meridionalis]|uniref:Uncharacterized protein n=1 Tax=Silurus meridionalis TaxID=175797 RepID=A0A8T0A546_SILME|nr:hypothetical protein HF521_015613 [Silurus meridionalis]
MHMLFLGHKNRDKSEYQGTEQLCWIVTGNKKIKMEEQNFENSLLQGTSSQKTHVVLDDDVVKALKDTVIK